MEDLRENILNSRTAGEEGKIQENPGENVKADRSAPGSGPFALNRRK